MGKIPAALKQKMAASVVGSAPSLVPGIASSPAAPIPEEDLLPSIDELIGEADDRTTLRQLISTQVPLNQQIKSLEKQLEPINKRIKAMVGQYGIDKAVCDGATISLSQSSRSTINAMKLIAAGVDETTIASCTDVTPIQTLKITAPKV